MDLSRVDLNLLVSLDVLLEECNVTRAAQRLHVSQPALSAHLGRLRHLFDDPLLVPASVGRGMTPTSRALPLRDSLKAALKGLEVVLAREHPFDPAQDARDFQIATTDNGIIVVGLSLLSRLQSEAGAGVRVAFRLLDTTQLSQQIERREVDLVIAPPSMFPPFLKARRIYDEVYAMAQRRDHPRGTEPLSLDGYCALDHVLVSLKGGLYEGRVDQALAKLGRNRRVRLSLPNFTSVPQVLQATDYVCTMPARFAKSLKDELDVFELPFAVPGFAMHMAWHPREQSDAAQSWLRTQVLEVVNSGR